MSMIVTLSAKHQLTLPAAIVRGMRLTQGSRLFVRVRDDAIALEKIEDSWDNVQGIAADTSIARKYTPAKVIQVAAKREARRLMIHD